jgi:energy-coupling factor transport system ATP-binding protein
MASRVGLSFQNCNDQFFKYRVEDEVLAGPRLLGKADSGWIEELYTIFDLHKLLERSPYRLSEGEKKRVSLASILAMQPQLLILDEPTVGQDGFFRETLADLLWKLEQRGLTTILVTHDLDFAQATADRWIILQDGRLVADGTPGALLQDARLFSMGALGGTLNPAAAGVWA